MARGGGVAAAERHTGNTGSRENWGGEGHPSLPARGVGEKAPRHRSRLWHSRWAVDRPPAALSPFAAMVVTLRAGAGREAPTERPHPLSPRKPAAPPRTKAALCVPQATAARVRDEQGRSVVEGSTPTREQQAAAIPPTLGE